MTEASRGRLTTRWAPIIFLATLALVTWSLASRNVIDTEPAQAISYDGGTATPVFSARRIPRTIQAPAADDALAPGLQQIVESSPPDSCLAIAVGNRLVEPATNLAKPLVPASNLKLVSTYGALNLLGPEFKFRTTAVSNSAVSDGVIAEDLYVVGSGDPFLTTDDWWQQYETLEGRSRSRLEDLADSIVGAGVTQIAGKLVGDESAFDSERVGPWRAGLISGNQSGPLSALSVNEGFTGWPEQFSGTQGRVPTDNPPLHAVTVLSELLVERGVTVGELGVGTAPPDANEVAFVESPPLIEYLTHINSYSSNIGAELLLKRVGLNERSNGSTGAGADAIVSLLNERSIPTEGLSMVDGSGLAETNQITCDTIRGLLMEARADSGFNESLAIAGERGTLAERYTETPAAGNLLAKTGNLNNVMSLSGYVQSEADPATTVVFTHIVNGDFNVGDVSAQASQDELVRQLSAYPTGPDLNVLSPLETEE